MKVTVIGGTGLVGSGVVARLAERGHEVVAASRRTGVDALTGRGLAEALRGAATVVDVSDAPSYEDAVATEFFTAATRNLLAAEAAAGVRHHVALSLVGLEWVPDSGYFRAKRAQEGLIRDGGIPYSIVRATQFYEFVEEIARVESATGTITVPPALVQPVAAADVAAAVCAVALGPPVDGIVEVGGPEQFRLDVLIDRWLTARGDGRPVVPDQTAPYFGAVLDERDLLPQFSATIGPTRLAAWLSGSAGAPDRPDLLATGSAEPRSITAPSAGP
ncbi:MAG TPA: SDR family oxidoreductase [Miltoncostaeaceae bacterium]|jgi:uncharacterized protein YbjT (DUF2867 family)|nr:SDR family oxidoreductase [Miltoncostaeaceae bacterium]